MLGEPERQEQIIKWNDTAVEVPGFRSVSAWFEWQAEKTPEACALMFEGKQLTYVELNRRANQLARHLKTFGVGPDEKVGLYVERSFEMVVGLLGIQKAGGAYVPLDPSFPLNRLAYMVEDSRMNVLITHRNLEKNLPTLPESVVRLDSIARNRETGCHKSEFEDANPPEPAWRFHREFPTGKPKGVEIPQSAVVNFLYSMQHEPGFAPSAMCSWP